MKSLSAPVLGMALACLLLSSSANAVLVVGDRLDLGGPNVLAGDVPQVDDMDVVTYEITQADALSGMIFFQFEANETSQSAITLGLTFKQDGSTFATYGPASLTPLSQNQSAFEWKISGLTDPTDVGSTITVELAISGATNGPERARFSTVSAVPEPSAFLLGGLVCSALGLIKFKSAFKK